MCMCIQLLAHCHCLCILLLPFHMVMLPLPPCLSCITSPEYLETVLGVWDSYDSVKRLISPTDLLSHQKPNLFLHC